MKQSRFENTPSDATINLAFPKSPCASAARRTCCLSGNSLASFAGKARAMPTI
ncbi:hypothetical protein ACVILL_005796 [Bradyrhizobium sp. USDA 3364]